MISKEYIQAWKTVAPWGSDAQVEQDLIISRALCEIFSVPKINESLAFRGGTALQKIFFKKQTRYSEDIDLVQIPKENIGEVIDLIRGKLDSWLGKPQVDLKTGRVTLRYRYDSTELPVQKMKLKIEINNAEHFTVFGYEKRPFAMNSEWFSVSCDITTFTIEEILSTKLRALYQRKKGRDIFDFSKAFSEYSSLDNQKIVNSFIQYMEKGGHKVSRAEYEKALHEKRMDDEFTSDIEALLPVGETSFNSEIAFDLVLNELISLLPGNPWKKETAK